MNRFHLNVLGQFFTVPYWAGGAGRKLPKPVGNPYPYGGPCDLDAFGNYVTQTVKHFPGIRYWEIWNEPDVSMFWNGFTEEFAALCKVAYESAKKANRA